MLKSCFMQCNLDELNVSCKRWSSAIFTYSPPAPLGLSDLPWPYDYRMYGSRLIELPKAITTKYLASWQRDWRVRHH